MNPLLSVNSCQTSDKLLDEVLYPSINEGSRADRAVAVLTELIASGKLSHGDFLPSEAALCRQLGVSRSTIRLALRTLETRGLVAARHGVGVQVTDRTLQVATESIGRMLSRRHASARDTFEIRLMLDCQAAALAAERATDDDILAISAAIETMDTRAESVDEFIRADFDFHLRLAEASKNQVLVALVHIIRELLLDTIAATYRFDPRVKIRVDEHTAVLEAVRAHDAARAAAAMRAHLQRTDRLLTEAPPPTDRGE